MLLWILIIIGVLFIIKTSIDIKYSNPYKLIFLLGAKGSGKSTLLVRYMTEYHKKGYSVYTNMDECNLPYVYHIKAEEIGKYVGRPKSMIALDEVGLIYDARKWKTFKSEWTEYYKFQRKYRNVVILTSQVWDCDKKVRALCDKYYLCHKIGAVSLAREFAMKDPFHISDDIEDAIRFVPFSWKLTWIPRYAASFQSFNPPERPYLEESDVTIVPLDPTPSRKRRRRGKQSA